MNPLLPCSVQSSVHHPSDWSVSFRYLCSLPLGLDLTFSICFKPACYFHDRWGWLSSSSSLSRFSFLPNCFAFDRIQFCQLILFFVRLWPSRRTVKNEIVGLLILAGLFVAGQQIISLLQFNRRRFLLCIIFLWPLLKLLDLLNICSFIFLFYPQLCDFCELSCKLIQLWFKNETNFADNLPELTLLEIFLSVSTLTKDEQTNLFRLFFAARLLCQDWRTRCVLCDWWPFMKCSIWKVISRSKWINNILTKYFSISPFGCEQVFAMYERMQPPKQPSPGRCLQL